MNTIKSENFAGDDNDWYTVDELGLESLKWFLMQDYAGRTVKIAIVGVS